MNLSKEENSLQSGESVWSFFSTSFIRLRSKNDNQFVMRQGTYVQIAMFLALLLFSIDTVFNLLVYNGEFNKFLAVRTPIEGGLMLGGTIVYVLFRTRLSFRFASLCMSVIPIAVWIGYRWFLVPGQVPESAVEQNGLLFFLAAAVLAVDRRWAIGCIALIFAGSAGLAIDFFDPRDGIPMLWNIIGFAAAAFVVGLVLDTYAVVSEDHMDRQLKQIERLRATENLTINIMRLASISLHARSADQRVLSHFMQPPFDRISYETWAAILTCSDDNQLLKDTLGVYGYTYVETKAKYADHDDTQIVMKNSRNEFISCKNVEFFDKTRAIILTDVTISYQDHTEFATAIDGSQIGIIKLDATGAFKQSFGAQPGRLFDASSDNLIIFVDNLKRKFETMNMGADEETTCIITNRDGDNFLVSCYELGGELVFLHFPDHSRRRGDKTVSLSEQKAEVDKEQDLSVGEKSSVGTEPDQGPQNSTDTEVVDLKSVPTIAIVDDNEVLAKSLAQLLNAHGQNAFYTTNESDFWQQFELHTNITGVILDYRMAGKDGIELGKDVLARDSSIRCLLLTGQITNEQSAEALKAGFERVFVKPVLMNEILSALK